MGSSDIHAPIAQKQQKFANMDLADASSQQSRKTVPKKAATNVPSYHEYVGSKEWVKVYAKEEGRQVKTHEPITMKVGLGDDDTKLVKNNMTNGYWFHAHYVTDAGVYTGAEGFKLGIVKKDDGRTYLRINERLTAYDLETAKKGGLVKEDRNLLKDSTVTHVDDGHLRTYFRVLDIPLDRIKTMRHEKEYVAGP
jgi:hypothetical protein